MPGDPLDPDPTFSATRAITINGTPAGIWPSLLQMGSGRAGFYGYDILENLESPRGLAHHLVYANSTLACRPSGVVGSLGTLGRVSPSAGASRVAMNDTGEFPFRVFVGLSWLLHFGLRLYFQGKIRGVTDHVRVNERQERILFRLFALGYLLVPLYFATPWVDFAHLQFPVWLRGTGGAVTGLGIGLFGWAHQALGRNWTAIPALSSTHQLVTHGPYRWVRHPMYAVFYALGLGFLLLSANWFVGAAYLGTLSIMYLVRVSAEEKMMLNRFGESYRQHMQKTGRLWPRIGR